LNNNFSEQINTLKHKIENLFKRNLQSGRSPIPPYEKYTYICPDIERYPHQWLWDSCFHIIVNSKLNLQLAKAEFETLLKCQFENGLIPHMRYWTGKLSFIDKKIISYYKNSYSSSITQPPLIPQALKEIYNANNDLEFVKKYINKIILYFDYLYNERVDIGEKVPLLSIIHSWESGMDNSPIYDKALNISGRFLIIKWAKSLLSQLKVLKECNWNMDCIRKKDYFVYKDLLFNCVYIQGCRDLALLLKECDMKDESERFLKRAKELENLIIKHCWNSEVGLFFGLYGKENTLDNIKSVSSLIPLILDGLPLNLASILVEDHLLNESEFWTNYPIPSVALDEPSFSNREILLWRGPTWININWFIHTGLIKHGFIDIAEDLAQKSLKLISKEGFREFYNPITGKGMRAKNFGWSALVFDMLIPKFNRDLDFLLMGEYRHVKKGPV